MRTRDKYQNLMNLSKSQAVGSDCQFMWNTACRFDDVKVVYNCLVYSFFRDYMEIFPCIVALLRVFMFI